MPDLSGLAATVFRNGRWLVRMMRRKVIVAVRRLESLVRPDTVWIRVVVSKQEMTVLQGWRQLHVWPISTARPGRRTPRGLFQPQSFSPDHYSSLYKDSPMPFSIFYDGNFAIHGTDSIEELGSPASHGCVRLLPENAHVLYDLVHARDKKQTYIEVRN